MQPTILQVGSPAFEVTNAKLVCTSRYGGELYTMRHKGRLIYLFIEEPSNAEENIYIIPTEIVKWHHTKDAFWADIYYYFNDDMLEFDVVGTARDELGIIRHILAQKDITYLQY